MSLRALSIASGLSPATLGNAITREREGGGANPDQRTCVGIAYAGGVSQSWVASGKGSPDAPDVPTDADVAGRSPAPRRLPPARAGRKKLRPEPMILVGGDDDDDGDSIDLSEFERDLPRRRNPSEPLADYDEGVRYTELEEDAMWLIAEQKAMTRREAQALMVASRTLFHGEPVARHLADWAIGMHAASKGKGVRTGEVESSDALQPKRSKPRRKT